MSLKDRIIVLVTNHKFQVSGKFSNLELASPPFILTHQAPSKHYGLKKQLFPYTVTHGLHLRDGFFQSLVYFSFDIQGKGNQLIDFSSAYT